MPDRTRHHSSATNSWDANGLLPAGLAARFKGPGALYNIGNLIALLAGIGIALRDIHSHREVMSGLHHHLMGSAPSAWLTASILIFIISGEFYHRAFHGAPEHRAGLNQSADLISGVAAIALTVALVGFGDTTPAIIAGLLLAGGKIGNAVIPALRLRHPLPMEQAMRLVVLGSRFPAILSLAISAGSVLRQSSTVEDALLPLIMIGCFLLWLWADVILLRQQAKSRKDFMKVS